jgi:hypothetical protein
MTLAEVMKGLGGMWRHADIGIQPGVVLEAIDSLTKPPLGFASFALWSSICSSAAEAEPLLFQQADKC